MNHLTHKQSKEVIDYSYHYFVTQGFLESAFNLWKIILDSFSEELRSEANYYYCFEDVMRHRELSYYACIHHFLINSYENLLRSILRFSSLEDNPNHKHKLRPRVNRVPRDLRSDYDNAIKEFVNKIKKREGSYIDSFYVNSWLIEKLKEFGSMYNLGKLLDCINESHVVHKFSDKIIHSHPLPEEPVYKDVRYQIEDINSRSRVEYITPANTEVAILLISVVLREHCLNCEFNPKLGIKDIFAKTPTPLLGDLFNTFEDLFSREN